MSEKRYYWLKLHKDFFKQKEIKKLRKIAGGDVYTIIYLKMLLQSLETDGFLYFEGYYDSFVEELADDIDEEEENVKIVVSYLISKGLMVEYSESAYLLTKCQEMTGSEAANARRMRELRLRRKQELLPSDDGASHCDSDVTNGDTEKEIEKEKELELEKSKTNMSSVTADFEYLWSIYPRKEGKKTALEAYKRAVKKGVSKETVETGILAYINKLNAECTERQYIKKGDTFFRGEHWDDDYSITGVSNGRFNKYGGISAGNTNDNRLDDTFI